MDKDKETLSNHVKAVPWQPRHLILNSIPGQKWIYHGLEFPLTSPAPLEGYNYLIVVDSFSKRLEERRCKNPTVEITIKFLHELFARVVDTFVSDYGN